jgi:hypothetical protein
MLSSTYKGFIAGVACVAVALFLGFGGGVWIAEWLNSDTAVPEQSRVARARAPDPTVQAAETPKQQSVPPQQEATAKAVRTETVSRANSSSSLLAARPLSPLPQSFTRPAATPPDALAAPSHTVSPVTKPQTEPARVASPEPKPQREVIRELQPRAPMSRREADRAASNEPARARPSKLKETRKQPPRPRQAENTGAATRQGVSEDDDEEIVETRERSPGPGRSRAPTREAHEEAGDRETVTEYRSAPRPPMPFFPLFGR